MKARRIKIDGVDRTDLIALIEANGNWSVITTVPAVRDFKPAFGFLDDVGLLRHHGEVVAVEEDVEFASEEFDVNFGSVE